MTDEAAQPLVDCLKLLYGVKAILEPKETISYFSIEFSTQTVFLGLYSDKINFWVFNKKNKVEHRQR